MYKTSIRILKFSNVSKDLLISYCAQATARSQMECMVTVVVPASQLRVSSSPDLVYTMGEYGITWTADEVCDYRHLEV